MTLFFEPFVHVSLCSILLVVAMAGFCGCAITKCDNEPPSPTVPIPHGTGDACMPGRQRILEGNEGDHYCSKCISGQADLDRDFLTPCVLCEEGTYASNAEGTFANDEAVNCTVCAAGRHDHDHYAATPCVACPSNQYQPSSGNTICILCEEGHFRDAAALTCVGCAAGRYDLDRDSATECDSCQQGQYQPNPNRTSCIECEAGYYGEGYGSNSVAGCILCGAGQYQPSMGRSACAQCFAGKYAHGRGQKQCQNCSVGHFAGTPGLPECAGCEAGKFAVAQGQTQCQDCHRGQYQPDTGHEQCIPCEMSCFE
eukprot:SAG11_NODE_6919_length_1225_cov_1.488455_2_plen_312_part_00